MRARTRLSLWAAGVAVFLLWSWAMMVAWSNSVAAFLVLGSVSDSTGEPLDGWSVTVANGSRWELAAETGADGDPGKYQIFQLDFGGNNAASSGDVLTVTFDGPDGESHTEERTLTEDDITSATIDVSHQTAAAPPAPTIDAIEPLTVKELGGETITVTGTNLEVGAVVVIGDIEVPLDVAGATDATAVLPALPVGTSGVIVRNPDDQEGPFSGVLTVEAALASDISGDGVVNIQDLVTVALEFGESGADLAGDVNGDGVVNIVDIVTIARDFGLSVVVAAPALAPVGDAHVVAAARTVVGSDTFSLDLSLRDVSSGIDNVGGYDVELAFDPSQLRLVGMDEGDMFGSSGVVFRQTHTDAEAAAGTARLLAVPLTDMASSGEGDVGTLRFHVIGSWDRALRSLRVVRADLADTQARHIRATLTPLVRDMRLTADGRTMAGQNYPNPFNPETWIPYQLTEDAEVTLRIYDAGGSMVRTLDLGRQPAGGHVGRDGAAYWDGSNETGEQVASGMYFYEFRAGAYSQVRRMVILK